MVSSKEVRVPDHLPHGRGMTLGLRSFPTTQRFVNHLFRIRETCARPGEFFIQRPEVQNGEGPASARLRGVVIVNRGGELLGCGLTRALRREVPVVDVQFGSELPNDLV